MCGVGTRSRTERSVVSEPNRGWSWFSEKVARSVGSCFSLSTNSGDGKMETNGTEIAYGNECGDEP